MLPIRTFFTAMLICLLFNTSVAQTKYPDNIYADTTFAPFYYGVASGDPLQDRVILWTKVFVADSTIKSINLSWKIADDSMFTSVLNSGRITAEASRDFTARIDATGLQANHTYFYRFFTEHGTASQIGIARTLPDDSVKHFKLAVVSCSSIWSGYFNAYRRIADRKDIDFVIHVGDYVYNYVDENEKVRVPVPYPVEPHSLAQWRERHTYYLLDPDLRAARQNKTWIAEWDNHDTDIEPPGKQIEAIQAFHEYLPIRLPDTTHPENIYRSFHFGTLADLNMIDMQIFRGKEEYEPGKKSVLNNVQDAWFKKQLSASKAIWKLTGNQEMMGSWLSEGAPKAFHLPGNGKVFDPGNWDGFPDDRNRLYDFLDVNHINNFVVMTGDAHMSFVMDLTKFPNNKKTYNHKTGQGSVGVEFLCPSISRGNMDESGVPKFIIPLIQSMSLGLNPHHLWCQFSKHGYTTLDVTPEKCTAEFWFSEILKRTNKESFAVGYTIKNGTNHWERKANKNRKKATR